MTPSDADLERRFGGLRRLYGDAAYARVRAARIAVVGLGGVGSWAVEALARCGVAELVLLDMDHVAESNVNRQVQALTGTLGQHKGLALQDRIAQIHPGCRVQVVEEFAGPDNWPGLLPQPVQAVIDACDQVRAKLAIAAWALREHVPIVCVGAAGGKTQAQLVEVVDLSEATHDPLLASLRQRLRKAGGAPQPGNGSSRVGKKIGVRCVFSREGVRAPVGVERAVGGVDGSLNCHGYGSTVTVTASFGMVAAGEALAQLIASKPDSPALRPGSAEAAEHLDIM